MALSCKIYETCAEQAAHGRHSRHVILLNFIKMVSIISKESQTRKACTSGIEDHRSFWKSASTKAFYPSSRGEFAIMFSAFPKCVVKVKTVVGCSIIQERINTGTFALVYLSEPPKGLEPGHHHTKCPFGTRFVYKIWGVAPAQYYQPFGEVFCRLTGYTL